MRWLVLLFVVGCGRAAAIEVCVDVESKLIVTHLREARSELERARTADLPEPLARRLGTKPIVRLHQIVERLASAQRDAFLARRQQVDVIEDAIDVALQAWIDGRGIIEATWVLRARLAAFEVVLAPWWAALERARVETSAVRPELLRSGRTTAIQLGRSQLVWIERQQTLQDIDAHRFDRLTSALTNYEACR